MAKAPQATESPFASLEKPYSFFRGLRHVLLDSKRREKPDPIPMQPPIGYKKSPSLSEQIRAMVRSEQLARDLAAQGVETFEEADDFDIPDDPVDPSTPYEADFEGDARQAILDAVNNPREYGSVEEFLRDNPNVKITAPSEQLRPEPTPYSPSGGVGEDLAIAPGETPPSPTPARAAPGKPTSFGFLRRG